ncbi:MAG: hypothetical protein ACRC33_21385 [Gemmataceae bacterium]
MGVFDQAARYAARLEPGGVLAPLLGDGFTGRHAGWFDTRSLPMPGGPDRAADLIAECEDAGGRWLVVLEFQSSHDPEKLDVTLLEAAVLRVHARHGAERAEKYRVLTALVYLRGTCPHAVLDMRLAGRGGTHHEALVWDIGVQPARDALDKVDDGRLSWGTLFWVPLMSGAAEPDLIARWRATAERLAPTSHARATLMSIAQIFAGLAGAVPEWRRELKGADMTESEVVNEWMAEASLLNSKRLLHRLVQKRFPDALTPDVLAAITDQPSQELLGEWFDAAATAKNADDFLAALRR